MARLLVVVPASRRLCGRIVLLSSSGEKMSGPFRVLAKASRRIGRKHGNPACARELPFGDPPTGSYALVGSWPPNTGHRRQRRFGALGALLFESRASEALQSPERARRTIALHGGETDPSGRLYPTRGGLRVKDAALLALCRAVNAAQERGDPVEGLELIDVGDELAVTSSKLVPARRKRQQNKPGVGAVAAFMAVLSRLPTSALGQSMPRRRFLEAALLLVGGLSAASCDSSSPCDPSTDPACIPPDPGGTAGSGPADGGYTAGGGSG